MTKGLSQPSAERGKTRDGWKVAGTIIAIAALLYITFEPAAYSAFPGWIIVGIGLSMATGPEIKAIAVTMYQDSHGSVFLVACIVFFMVLAAGVYSIIVSPKEERAEKGFHLALDGLAFLVGIEVGKKSKIKTRDDK